MTCSTMPKHDPAKTLARKKGHGYDAVGKRQF